MSQPVTTERDEFDKWVRDNDLWSAMYADGSGAEQWAWEAWQARAELRQDKEKQ